VADLLGVGQVRAEGDFFDMRQWRADTLTDILDQRVQGVTLVGAAAAVAFFVFPLTRMQGALHRQE